MKTIIKCYLFILFFSVACSQNSSDIEKVLKKADENRAELEKVISHYSQRPSDSLKLKAAIFLISNLDGLYSLDSTSTECNKVFYNALDSLNIRYANKVKAVILYNTLDSIKKIKNNSSTAPKLMYSFDLANLKANFLIDNIDRAFYSWQHYQWSKHIPFADFCEYILPYRVINTYWTGTREYFMQKYVWLSDSVNENDNCFSVAKKIDKEFDNWFVESGSVFQGYDFLVPLTMHDLLRVKRGDCYYTNSVKVAAMRSMGIPVAFEIIPNWGNVRLRHYFYKVIDPKNDTIRCLLNNSSVSRDTRYFISGSFYTEIKTPLPADILVIYNKTIPKIFRLCYSRQPESLGAIKSSKDKVPEFFENDRLKDVTKEYLECGSVNLELPNPGKNKYVYLGVFEKKGWIPVDWAKIENKKAFFHNLGKNIVYQPIYNNNETAAPPFLLTLEGKMRALNPLKDKFQTMKIIRKYPLTSNTVKNILESFGGRFQGANRPDFSDSVNLYTINKFPYYMTEVSPKNTKKFRYLIFQFKGKETASLAELEFWGVENGKEVKLTGLKIGNPGDHGHSIDNVMDGDRLKYFKNEKPGPTYIGLDLGRGHEKCVTKIRFCPRNDTNNILPDNSYELFYWDKEWKSLGIKKGEDMKPLIYEKVPVGALFWLQNRSEGQEERIFTYENDQQVWW